MTTDDELTKIPVWEAWVRLCCETPEMVENYNRLRGTKLRFTLPPRSGIEMLVDKATGNEPSFGNDPEEQREFFAWCTDTLLRLPMLRDPRYFQDAGATAQGE